MFKKEEKFKERLVDILSEERGLFGHVSTFGQGPTPYEYIGYELSEDITPLLVQMNQAQRSNLVIIAHYFETHAGPLKLLLDAVQSNPKTVSLDIFFAEKAWSHFMTVVMFGMLEVAVKITPFAVYNSNQHLKKQASINAFLKNYIPKEMQEEIVRRYTVDEAVATGGKFKSFSEVINHLWHEIRSGFIHEAGFESKGMEWTILAGGMGTKDDPIKIISDVPMPEWLQLTWQTILKSYGYKGTLEHHRIERKPKATN